MTPPAVGETFSVELVIAPEDVALFARFIGDHNPIHHDAAAAAASRSGGIVASGAHTASLMMGALATQFSKRWANVGLGYAVRLRKPVYAGQALTVTWTVASVEDSAKLKGIVVRMEGTLTTPSGVAITATSDALITGPLI